ncbi:sigma-70 family RNA polymerase sigma factor [Candidatus Poribacteria bacterium]|nr:sigma-70 family RNA polymerase sigma factor [Candidatus Poribacteria bacterium]
MVEDDVQLIDKILAGDDEAFTALVRKHQKSVHALAWRKVGDFHIAEEITQDTFLRVYKHLSKLKDPNQFSGWLYVTTARLCNTWLRKNKSLMESLEEVPMAEVEKAFYEHYVSTQHEEESHSHHQELVKKLLAKLPESERTVMTLYYLGEMTAKEIGKFLGVSVNTITSRLQRARERLKQDEELLVQEMLGSVQLSESLTQNIVRKVADMKPVSPSAGKPFLPWIGFGAAAILVVMFLLGVSNQYLVRFQKPYSFEAQSEPTVEIIDAPVILNIDAKPAVRNQAGRAVTTRNSRGTGVQISESDVASHAEVGAIQLSTSQWAQTAGPQGGPVFDIFATDAGTIYTLSPTGIYRLSPDTPPWTLVNSSLPIEGSWMPMAAHEGMLYIVFKDTVFASTDDGETWEALCSRPGGHAIELVIVNEAQNSSSREHSTMYLALRDKGVFRSTDIGGQWVLLDDGLMGGTISAMVLVVLARTKVSIDWIQARGNDYLKMCQAPSIP